MISFKFMSATKRLSSTILTGSYNLGSKYYLSRKTLCMMGLAKLRSNCFRGFHILRSKLMYEYFVDIEHEHAITGIAKHGMNRAKKIIEELEANKLALNITV